MADLNYQIDAILNDVSINDVTNFNLKTIKRQQLQQYLLYTRLFNAYRRRFAGFQKLPPQLEMLLQHFYEKETKCARFNEIELEKNVFDNLEIINY